MSFPTDTAALPRRAKSRPRCRSFGATAPKDFDRILGARVWKISTGDAGLSRPAAPKNFHRILGARGWRNPDWRRGLSRRAAPKNFDRIFGARGWKISTGDAGLSRRAAPKNFDRILRRPGMANLDRRRRPFEASCAQGRAPKNFDCIFGAGGGESRLATPAFFERGAPKN
jgi:hypothetical protein